MNVIRKSELSRFWKSEKHRMFLKANQLSEKLGNNKIVVPGTYMDILIGDRELHEMFGDENPEVACYGGIQITPNIEAFLRLPSKFRIYSSIDKTQAKKKTEESVAADRWDFHDRQERENEGERLTPDELRRQKDEEHRRRRPFTAEVIDLAKVRCTDLPGNKDIMMPAPASLREELKIQGRMQEYLDVVNQYLNSECDSRGMPRDGSNLTPAEKAGRDEIRDGIKNKGWMLYNSDKSGNLVLDTKDNFLK